MCQVFGQCSIRAITKLIYFYWCNIKLKKFFFITSLIIF